MATITNVSTVTDISGTSYSNPVSTSVIPTPVVTRYFYNLGCFGDDACCGLDCTCCGNTCGDCGNNCFGCGSNCRNDGNAFFGCGNNCCNNGNTCGRCCVCRF